MEHIWVKSTNQEESEKLAKIAQSASENIENKSPTKEMLDEEIQRYIDIRFPVTNEDNLQEDAAQKFVIDSNYLDELHKNEALGEQVNQEIVDGLWRMYEKMLEQGAYLDLQRELSPKINKLLDSLKVLELQNEIKEQFPMAKSAITNKEAFFIAQNEISHIKSELDSIRNEEVSPQSVGQLLEQYKALSEKYQTVRALIEPENSALN